MPKLRILLLMVVFTLMTWNAHSQQTPGPTTSEICLAAQQSCRQCISAHAECGWCSAEAILGDSPARCRHVSDFPSTLCAPSMLESPTNKFNATRDLPLSINTQGEIVFAPIQLKPQALNIKLRIGQPETFNITFRRITENPLDLYYVMDLSFSMSDDLQRLKELGQDLVRSTNDLTRNVRRGFGTFVDKVMMPFASTVPAQLFNPCVSTSRNESCEPVFGFRHQLPLTDDGQAFIKVVDETRISGNIDSPEGGFDALMQIAVCQNEIKWRDDALRVILFTTDASPHIANDGKLAAILELNDMQCHLEKGVHEYLKNATVYSKSKTMDYPSIGQLKKAFDDNSIQTIFAVTEEVSNLYQDLPNILGNSFVRTLNNDSSNVIEVINESYRALRGRIQVTRPIPPANVDMRYRVLCPGEGWVDNSTSCSSVQTNDDVVFEFTLTARSCPPNPAQTDTMNITASTIADSVSITIEYLCDCNCTKRRVVSSPQCSGRGALECGVCQCDPGNAGSQCQCNGTTVTLGTSIDSGCRAPGDTDLCSGRGDCECGKCSNCRGGSFNQYCHCTRTGCQSDDGGDCGGPEKGTCTNCGTPICECNAEDGYFLNQEQTLCSCNTQKYCVNTNISSEVCNGQGSCPCDKCECNENFAGRYCDRCVRPACALPTDGSCTGLEIQQCAICVNQQLGEDTAGPCQSVCADNNLLHSNNDTIPDCTNCVARDTSSQCQPCLNFGNPPIHQPLTCTSFTASGCSVNYRIFWNTQRNKYLIYVQNFNTDRDCPAPADPLIIVLPVIGGIVLIGLLALILWKIFQTIRDKNEYQNFLEDTKKSQWSKGENPLFHKPTDRIENPAYIGAN